MILNLKSSPGQATSIAIYWKSNAWTAIQHGERASAANTSFSLKHSVLTSQIRIQKTLAPRVIPHTGDNVVVATELEGLDPNDFSLKYCSRCKHPHYLLGDSDDLVDDYNLYCIACGSYLLSETVEEKASRLRRC